MVSSAFFSLFFIGHHMGSKYTRTDRYRPNYRIGPDCADRAYSASSWLLLESKYFMKQENETKFQDALRNYALSATVKHPMYLS